MDINNSPALQGHLNPSPTETLVYSEPKDFDVTCPEIPNNRPNTSRDTCVMRLTSGQVELCCRRCETGQKIAQELNLKVSAYKINNPPVDLLKTTPVLFKYGVCTRCGEAKISQARKYCQSCRDIVDEENDYRKNVKRRERTAANKLKRNKQKTQDKIVKLKQQLKDMEV